MCVASKGTGSTAKFFWRKLAKVWRNGESSRIFSLTLSSLPSSSPFLQSYANIRQRSRKKNFHGRTLLPGSITYKFFIFSTLSLFWHLLSFISQLLYAIHLEFAIQTISHRRKAKVAQNRDFSSRERKRDTKY